MVAFSREIAEGPQIHGEDEQIAYIIDISNWSSSPSAVEVQVKVADTGQDVTGITTTGLPIVLDPTHIMTPIIHSLTKKVIYRVDVKYTVGAQVLEFYLILRAEE